MSIDSRKRVIDLSKKAEVEIQKSGLAGRKAQVALNIYIPFMPAVPKPLY